MATPAEIIAARINGLNLSPEIETTANVLKPSASKLKVTSINDENAFPVLGGGAKAANGGSASSSWGPNLNGASSAPAASALKSSGQGVLKTSTVQEAFSLDAEDQLNVARPEFVKILTAIKASTSAGIECTSSQHTKKRTFLITGKPEQVKQAKRLVIKKLSKPIVTSFAIPAKVRSRVIGAQGRNLKPIIQQTEVKIEIGNLDRSVSPEVDDDDIFAQTVTVVLEGDAESCKMAKNLIMNIVKEETKNAQTKVVVGEKLNAFVNNLVKPLSDKYTSLDITAPPFGSSSKSVIILGPREDVLAAKDELNVLLSVLESKLVTELVNIPKSKHQFLPVEQILKEDNVYIRVPADGEGLVEFIGEKHTIASAKEKARQTTSQFKVESLDMSKAHKGNLNHVRAVASMLNKYGVFDQIAFEHGVQVKPPSDAVLRDELNTLIPVDIVVNSADADAAKNSRRAVVAAVNAISPSLTKVISDIDPFFIKAATEVLEAFNGVKYVVLNNAITLFSATEASNGDDFDDFEEQDNNGLIEADRALNPLRSLQEGLVSEVLQVKSADQKHISGSNGSTLKAVLSQFETNAVQIKLHSNGAGSSSDEVYIKGFERDVAKVKNDIEEIIVEVSESSKNGGYSTSATVPAFILPRLIGKGGSNVKEIVDEFGVEINVSEEGKNIDKNDKLATVEIQIKGLKRNAEAAKAKVVASAKKLADNTVVRLRIENQYHKRISGPSFSSINRLQKKYNVFIVFPSDNSNTSSENAPHNQDEIVIRGPSRNVAKAQEELTQLYQFEKENGFKSSLKIPKAAIGRVIGKNGDNMRDISDATGVEILFRERKEENEFAEVDIIGSKSGLKEATEKIQSIIEEVENTITTTLKVNRKYLRDIVGQNGSTLRKMITSAGGDSLSRQQYTNLVTIPANDSESDEIEFKGDKAIVDKLISQIEALVAEKEAAITETYELAKEKQKLLVGSFGSIRRSLEEEFGVQLMIPKPNDKSTTLKLIGLPEKIEKLKVKIEELTKDNWNVSVDIPLAYHAFVSDKGSFLSTLRQKFNVEVSHGNLNRTAFKALDAIPRAPPAEAQGEDEATKFTTKALETPSADGAIIPWRLIGSDNDTAEAAKLIESRLEQAKNATTAAWFYSKTPSAHFPKIIGPQGSKIRKIRETTGCFITVPRDSHKYSDYVYLEGTEEGLKKAEEQIKKLL